MSAVVEMIMLLEEQLITAQNNGNFSEAEKIKSEISYWVDNLR